jgi:transposase-like protein
MASRFLHVCGDDGDTYPRVLEQVLPEAWHRINQYANNRIEANHAQGARVTAHVRFED